MYKSFSTLCFAALIAITTSCDKNVGMEYPIDSSQISLSSVAGLLADLPLTEEHYAEVFEAVSSSDENGYDEEYTMSNLFSCPGKGVGDKETKAGTHYSHPMRELIRDYCSANHTKSSNDISPELLENSDIQIYWPYSSEWDHETAPIITFDPKEDINSNIGYEIINKTDGTKETKIVKVSEETAKERPVWVVNTNDDSRYNSLELLRRENPEWGKGGDIIVTKASEETFKTLILKKIRMNKNYDSWFAGASEFFIKMGSIESFNASTEAELLLYSPSVTDFMISVKRNQLGVWVPFNAVMISQWSDKLEEMAFMIIEDDGGTRTSWKFQAVVKVNSKSYGIDMEIPLNQKDDIVWRGGLSSLFLEKYQGQAQHFGGVDLVFDFI